MVKQAAKRRTKMGCQQNSPTAEGDDEEKSPNSISSPTNQKRTRSKKKDNKDRKEYKRMRINRNGEERLAMEKCQGRRQKDLQVISEVLSNQSKSKMLRLWLNDSSHLRGSRFQRNSRRNMFAWPCFWRKSWKIFWACTAWILRKRCIS